MNDRAYRGSNGRAVSLGEELGAGGEGTVLSIFGSPKECAKIYRPERAEERAGKLQAMLTSRPSWLLGDAIVWPTELLYSDDARATFAGFVMPAARGMVELHRLIVPDERMQFAGFLTAKDLCVLAAAIARLVDGVHRAGHCVGDLKPQNILVAPLTGRAALVDTDSFQIRERPSERLHPSPVVTPEYTAPELFDDPVHTPRTPASDAFALAILVHQLLLGGAHPFEGELASARRSVERIPGRIRRGLCPLAPGVTGIRPAAGALSAATLHPGLRALFAHCFGAGHERPEARPDPAAWRKALLVASRSMVRCASNEAHLHDGGLARCPFCERRERTGFDLFPAGQAWQRTIARLPDPRAAPERERIRWLRRHARDRTRAGEPTERESTWLLKAGAALGLDRVTVTKTLADAAAPRHGFERVEGLRTWAHRLRFPLCATSIASIIVVASTRALVAPKPLAAVTENAHAPPSAALPQLARIGNTRGRGAFLRAAPSTVSAKLSLPEGTVVRLTGQTRSGEALTWSEVTVEPRGRAGWVATKYLVYPVAWAAVAPGAGAQY